MMNKTNEPLSSPETTETENTPPRQLGQWRKILLIAALVIGAGGLILQGIAYFTAEKPAPESSAAEFKTQSLAPRHLTAPGFTGGSQTAPMPTIGETETAPSVGVVDWSSLLMKLGFSFVVGFSISYAISGFLRLALFIAGLIFLLLFGLQYAGIVDVHWQNMSNYYDAFISWLQPRISTFKDFITSNLPASGMASAGLIAGFKR